MNQTTREMVDLLTSRYIISSSSRNPFFDLISFSICGRIFNKELSFSDFDFRKSAIVWSRGAINCSFGLATLLVVVVVVDTIFSTEDCLPIESKIVEVTF